MIKELVCIGCPMGCALTVGIEGAVIQVSGNACPRGEKYAKNEVTCPMRMLSSTVALEGADLARLPVKLQREIPKDRLMDCMNQIRRTSVRAPVTIGSVIIHNCANTGVDVVATRSVRAKIDI